MLLNKRFLFCLQIMKQQIQVSVMSYSEWSVTIVTNFWMEHSKIMRKAIQGWYVQECEISNEWNVFKNLLFFISGKLLDLFIWTFEHNNLLKFLTNLYVWILSFVLSSVASLWENHIYYQNFTLLAHTDCCTISESLFYS